MLDLFQPGAYARAAGGNLERPDIQKPVIRWMSWSINPDNGGNGNTTVWDKARALWKADGIADFPWLHCRTIADVERLIRAGEVSNSPAIGLNVEDVVKDGLSLQEVGGLVLDFWVNKYQKPVHMATLPWVQNGQGWQYVSFAVAALEIFPDEQKLTFPNGYDPVVVQQCIDHAFAEGLTKVTLMFKTKPPQTAQSYGQEFSVCHSLYTADDITPTKEAWDAWIAPAPCTKVKPPVPKPPLTATQVPYTGPYSLPSGKYRSRGPTAKALKIAMKRMGQEPFKGKDNSSFDEHYNQPLEAALDRTTNSAWNGYGEKRWEAVRALVTADNEYALNKEARDLIKLDYTQTKQPVLPNLGPLWSGGKSVLDQAPTHPTAGIPYFIAFDDAYRAGTIIIAPEDMEVFKDSSSNPGDACYCRGLSKLEYWLGHLVSAPAVGRVFTKGQQIGVVLDHHVGGGPHVHCGVNIQPLFGVGEQLEWGADGDGPDYTYGSPTIREQLAQRSV